jgi:arylsulfatase A-like enzyme
MRTLSIVLCVLTTLAGCAEPPPRKPVNLVLITLDACRAGELSAYGYERKTTPNIDALAAKSVLFERAYSQAASTAPSLSSLMTSKWVHQHGVIQTYNFALGSQEQTLAERLRAAGLVTAAFAGIGILMPSRRLDQGFMTYSFTNFTNDKYWKPANELTDEAIAWLDATHEAPFFLWVHYFEPHLPYDIVPAEFLERFVDSPTNNFEYHRRGITAAQQTHLKGLIDSYDGSLAWADSQVGRLLERIAALGLLDRTMIILTADHGEGLGEHGLHGHVFELYQQEVRVPLLIYLPGVQPARVTKVVGHVDLLPTVLAQLGLPTEGEMAGIALPLPMAPGAEATIDDLYPNRPMFSETWLPNGRKTMITRGRWKLILSEMKGKPDDVQLFDIEADPAEARNLAASEPEKHAELEAKLRAWMRTGFTEPGLIGRVEPKELEMLRALGYVQ